MTRRAAFAFVVAALLASAASAAAQAPPQDGSQDVAKWIRTPTVESYKPFLPGVTPYSSAGSYEKWWQEIAACEHLPLPERHTGVRFFAVNAVHFYDALRPFYVRDPSTGLLLAKWAVAATYLDEEAIYVALPYLFDEQVLKHEMVHLLMRWAGEKSGHPPARFETCGITTEKN